MSGYTVAVLGATGAVGAEFLRVLEQRKFPIGEMRLLASPNSAGLELNFGGRDYAVEPPTPEAFAGVHIAFFSAGNAVSAEWAPIAAAAGAVVIDNTSHFRMEDDVPLVVPEVNGTLLAARPPRGIISVPNCSTIPLVQVLDPLNRAWGVKRVVVATYQSVSGKGARAIEELRTESTRALAEGRSIGHGASRSSQTGNLRGNAVFPYSIAFNLLPHIDVFTENGYTKEEMKMVDESRKILNLPGLMLSATCVRVPVFRCHSLAVNATFKSEVDVAEARKMLAATPGIVVLDAPERNDYPMPRQATGLDDTLVGRIRRDISSVGGTGLDMWIVSDNLRKGAALNGVQIAEGLIERGALTPA